MTILSLSKHLQLNTAQCTTVLTPIVTHIHIYIHSEFYNAHLSRHVGQRIEAIYGTKTGRSNAENKEGMREMET